MGLIIGISFIEALLDFTASGVTIPLGLGIGRRVFLAMNSVEVLIGIALLEALISLWCNHRYYELPNFNCMQRYGFIALGLVVITTAIIRPAVGPLQRLGTRRQV
ncbi:hypothetical protein [Enteractinococcus helveticum]|uniref:Uncharacterized protein n=1 Tax=Enteractinococcus helveticum TaxID=1837282 RepID=A0A1B7LV86_9MICC|nr:hypothetical protein [Enteractinococcus helveticum]OAV52033.1 hypothetical protein A6F49_01365 [Enteractinococcus helveticum]